MRLELKYWYGQVTLIKFMEKCLFNQKLLFLLDDHFGCFYDVSVLHKLI